MIRKNTISTFVAIAMTLAILMGLLFTPVTAHVRADGAQPALANGVSGGGNTGG